MEKTWKKKWKKNVAIFIGSQSLSIFGSSLVQFAITIHITLSTGSGVAAMISILCSFLPMLILSPFAGVWADRYNKKKLIILSDGFIAVCTLVVAILFMMGWRSNIILYVASAIRSLGSAIQTPSTNAILPSMVPEDQLTRVNGIQGSLQSLITLISPMMGAGLLVVLGIEHIFFIDVITAAIAIIILFFFLETPDDEKKEKVDAPDYLKELKLGLAYVRQRKFLLYLFIFIGVFCLLAGPVAFLTPLQTARTYGEEEWRIGAIDMAFSGGMLLGGILLSIWSGFKNKIHTISLASFLMGITTIVMGLAPSFPLYLTAMGICGMFMPMYNTPGVVLLQEQVDPAYLGRVFSVVSMINMSLMPLGMLVFGPVADVIPIEWLLLGTGIGFLVVAVAMINNRTLLKLGVTPPRVDTPMMENPAPQDQQLEG